MAHGSVQLCFWPAEVFLLLVDESQGRHSCCTVNAKSGSRSWSCFWPLMGKWIGILFGISIFVIHCEQSHPFSCVGHNQCLQYLIVICCDLLPFIADGLDLKPLMDAGSPSVFLDSFSFLSFSIVQAWSVFWEEDCIILTVASPELWGLSYCLCPF